ncbi:DUF4267 domain-containing protein [Actinoalloteichus sp. AHMU CJ021]|uniref:DUF4267 domain-containing protein n=1 Tax=Actinoalloteichus caeruleus DSM 43889 TaxID=1120930 RepID=A0ABT1JJ64_ACTCY|nr:DUF4267 domain-containing protein [Actinoalloteichus caeruleus]AUS78459.1 DUF4267 domain-containing protein [Actinoalloteichus sp. AHMU CJ021]MCP2332555.1 protein of unknown function (DUF4267) [Actinoalloteichus caeruleus DSM 43889]
MATAGVTIATLAGLAILTIGVLYLLAPRPMAASFGLPSVPEGRDVAWLRLKGVRDLATGVVAFTVLFTAPAATLGWTVAAFTIVPIGDAVTVLRADGRRSAAYGIHGATAVLMLIAAGFLVSAA